MSKSTEVTCGQCGRSFPDIYPAARCPYEADHEYVTYRSVVASMTMSEADGEMGDEHAVAEALRILADRIAAEGLPDLSDVYLIRDINGNRVGYMGVKEEVR